MGGGNLVIDHDVVRLDVAVHDAVRVAVLEGLPRAAHARGWAPPQHRGRIRGRVGGGCAQGGARQGGSRGAGARARLEQLEDVVADVVVGQRGVEHLEVRVVHVLKDEARRLRLWVAHGVEKPDDVGTAGEVLQDLDLALDLLLFDRLEDLDDHLRVAPHVHPLKHLTVLTTADLAHDLIVVLLAPTHLERLIVPVVLADPGVGLAVPARAAHRAAAGAGAALAGCRAERNVLCLSGAAPSLGFHVHH